MALSVDDIKVERLTFDEAQQRGVTGWSVWTKEIATFDWTYDSRETCYIVEGSVIVEANGKSITLGEGDFVKFPKGLNCLWRIKDPIKKYYQFN